MKRTYSKPQTRYVAAADNLLQTLTSWGSGKYSGDGKKLDIDDSLTDVGKVITDKDLKEGDYDPWDSSKW